jgi:enterobacterial common antigen flippase
VRLTPKISLALGGNPVGALVSAVAMQAALIASGVVVARVLGPEGRGHVALLMLIPSLLYQLGSLGGPLAVTFYLAQGASLRRDVIASARRLAATQIATMTLAHAALLATFVALRWFDDVRLAAYASLPLVPATVTYHYALAVVQGERRFIAFNVLRLVLVCLYALGVVLLMLASVANAFTIMMSWTTAYSCLALAAVLTARRRCPNDARSRQTAEVRPGQLVRFGARAVVGAASPVENYRLDQLAVGMMLPPAALGYYVVATALTNLPRFLSQSIGFYAYPQAAARQEAATGARLVRVIAVGVVATLVLAAGLAAAAGLIIPVLFGQEFEPAVPIARILLLGGGLLAVRRIVVDFARGAGRPGIGTAGELAAWVVLVPSFAIAVPVWGAEGAAAAVAASAAVALAVSALMLYRRPVRRTVGDVDAGAAPGA